MRFVFLYKKKVAVLIMVLLSTATVMAQDEAVVQKSVLSKNNQLVILLVALMLVLVFVIWLLSQALLSLSKQLLNKRLQSRDTTVAKSVMLLLIAVMSLASQPASAQATDAATETVKMVSNFGGLSATTFYLLVAVMIVELTTIIFLSVSIRNVYKELFPETKPAIVKEGMLKAWWHRMDKKVFTKSIPIEREADHLLDHNYDGIQELDNALPPWWKYGFYATIVVAFIYLFHFHVLATGKNPLQEYETELQTAKIKNEIFEANNKDKIDENNIQMADAGGLAKAKAIFESKCFACHGMMGGGGAGPNLTDDNWLHKGSLKDIYASIKNGYPDKGMQSWAKDFTPKEMSFLASYIKSLHGTKPAGGIPPQGDIYNDTNIKVPDSAAKVVADTVKLLKN